MTNCLDTVGWSGDGDDTDFFYAVENTFNLKLRSYLPWTTFGEVHDHVVAMIDRRGGDGDGCSSQMAFYRIRQALNLSHHVGPDEPLRPNIDWHLQTAFKDLEASTDLNSPRPRLGILSYIALAAAVAALSLWGMMSAETGVKLVCAVLVAILAWLLWIGDPRRLPKGCRSLGELAEKAANLNRGRLAQSGARLRPDESWQIIQRLAAEETGVDPQTIGRATTFFRSK